MKKRSITLIVLSLTVSFMLAGCLSTNPYVSPPNGGTMVIPRGPLLLTGTSDEGKSNFTFNDSYPDLIESETIKGNFAGFVLIFNKGEMAARYVYAIDITKPYAEKVYTQTFLEDPADPENSIKYTHYLDPDNEHSEVAHGPLENVEAGKLYELSFEIYADEARTQLLDRLDQSVQASFSNVNGCIELSDEAKATFLRTTDQKGNPIPPEKVVFPCRKASLKI